LKTKKSKHKRSRTQHGGIFLNGLGRTGLSHDANPEAIKEKTKRTPHDYIKIKIKCEGDAS
jgi:hypothetical protein